MLVRLRPAWPAAFLTLSALFCPPGARSIPHQVVLAEPISLLALPPTPDPAVVGECAPRIVKKPSDTPTQLTCEQARIVAAQARENLAQPPPRVDPRAFAESTADWLDPHGLWSAAKDSPVGPVLRNHAAALLAELANPSNNCPAARAVGRSIGPWIQSQQRRFDRAHEGAIAPKDPFSVARQALMDDDSPQSSARSLAKDLGERTASLLPLGTWANDVHQAVRTRMLPSLSPEAWTNVVLAAALRAYVLQIDPHGAWAPWDEETTLYQVEFETSGRRHLWGSMTRTAAGVRIDDHPVPPLAQGDVVLAIDDILLAGLSVEQIEQVGVLDPNDDHPARDVLVLRGGETQPIRLTVIPPPASPFPRSATQAIDFVQIPYGAGKAVLITARDVADDLGVALANALASARIEAEPEGVVLDLRGNGGGSIEGAKDALSLFLPGANLFPMRRRRGFVEVERAPEPASTDVWPGPVAVIVDGETASAAEMIAGAIMAYQRGVVLGSRTFGKGCAQEYLEDDTGQGMLRLSTLTYSLPDGQPVQRVGMLPDVPLSLPEGPEREDALPNAMAIWKGPDVRTPQFSRWASWPRHEGNVGPCDDAVVCDALRRLGEYRHTAPVRVGKAVARRNRD